MQSQYKLALVTCLAAFVVSAMQPVAARSCAIDPLKQTIRQSSFVSMTDLSLQADPDLPKIAEYKNLSVDWDLIVSAPIIWTDEQGNSHELESLNGAWKKWLDSFAKQTVKRWTAESNHPNETCSASISLMAERKPVNGISFTPEQNPESESFTNIVKDATGISSGKQLGAILPKDAKGATALYLNLRFVRR